MAFEPHELKLAVVSAIRIVPNGLQLIPRVPACTTAAFILQPLPKNWNFLVLVFSRIRSKPMWTLGKVDYAWVRPYWYPAFYSPSWTYHLAKETHQHIICYFLAVGGQIDGVDLVVGVDFSKTNCHFQSQSPTWCPNVESLPKQRTHRKSPMQAPLPAIVRKKQPVGDIQEIVLLSIDDVHWHHTGILATKNIF